MALKVLITGITGFAGSHLAEYLLQKPDVEVFGFYRWRSRMENLHDVRDRLNKIECGVSSVCTLKEAIRPGRINLIDADMGDPSSMKKAIGAVEPDRIFHLAAQSFVPTSWSAPADTLTTNILGEVNIFEAVRELGLSPLIHIAGTSEEYGLVYPNEIPIKEENPLRPLSPYAVSKVAQEKLAYQYFMSYGLKTIVSRGFNHEGPRRGEVFVTSSFAKQIAEIEKNSREPVMWVGDLTSSRDWTDVRDMVRAYWLLLEKGTPGEVYNIGSGSCRQVQEMLDTLLSMTTAKIEVKQDPARLRPSDVKILCADYSKFHKATGWTPEIPFEQTMRDLLNFWRERV
jgi:GDP-4-dehydro-6-deoxy-D-mannose reductase